MPLYYVRLSGYSPSEYEKAVDALRGWAPPVRESMDGSRLVRCVYDGSIEELSHVTKIPVERISNVLPRQST